MDLESQCPSYYQKEASNSGHSRTLIGMGLTCFMVAAFVSFSPATSNLMTVPRSLPSSIVQTSSTPGLATLRNQANKAAVTVQGATMNTFEAEKLVDAEPVQTSSFRWTFAAAMSASIVPLVALYKRWVSDADSICEDDDIDSIEEEADWAIAAAVGEVKLQYTAELPVKDAAGSAIGKAELCLKTAGANSRHVIHRKLVAEFANRRQANAHTKTRGEVSGGGKKPYKQKGTGNARRGSTRSPLMRHGGVAFGPRNTKNYKQKINKKEGRLAISSLIQNRAPLITVIKDMEDSMNVISTKKAAEMIDSWKDKEKGEKVLLVIDVPGGKLPTAHPLVMSTKNLGMARLMSQKNLAVADLLWPHQIFVSEKALDALKARFEVPFASDESDASVA